MNDNLQEMRLRTLIAEHRTGRNVRLDLNRDGAPFLAALGSEIRKRRIDGMKSSSWRDLGCLRGA